MLLLHRPSPSWRCRLQSTIDYITTRPLSSVVTTREAIAPCRASLGSSRGERRDDDDVPVVAPTTIGHYYYAVTTTTTTTTSRSLFPRRHSLPTLPIISPANAWLASSRPRFIHRVDSSSSSTSTMRDPYQHRSKIVELVKAQQQAKQRNQQNEYGHDYSQTGKPMNTTISHISLPKIHKLIRLRMQHRRERNYQEADRILEKLRRFGIFMDDTNKEWRGDGIPFPPRGANPDIEKYSNKYSNSIKKGVPRMTDCETMEEAIEAMMMTSDDNFERMKKVKQVKRKASPRDISAFWTVVPRLLKDDVQWNSGDDDDDDSERKQLELVEQLNSILDRTLDRMEQQHFGPRDLTPTALAFAKIRNYLQNSDKRHVAGSYHEFLHDVLEVRREEIFQSIARTSRPILSQFEPRYLSNLAYAYALVEYVPEKFDDGSSLFGHIAKRSIPSLNKFQPQELSSMIWAFERAKVSHPSLFAKVANHIVSLDHLGAFNPQALSNLVRSYAKIAGEESHHHPALFGKIGNHIHSLEHLREYTPQNLSNIAWAFAKADTTHPSLFHEVANHIASHCDLRAFKPQELSILMWAFSKVWIFPPRLFEKVAIHIESRRDLRGFEPQALSNIALAYSKAYATVDIAHPRLFDKVADHILSMDDGLEDFNEQEISNIGGAFSKADAIDSRLFDKLSAVAIDRQDEFSSHDIAKLLRWKE